MMLPLLLSMLLTQSALPAKTGALAGTLRLSDGKPASGVRIAVMDVPGAGRGVPRGAGTLVIQGQTDASGKYRLDDIPAGAYYLVAGRVDNPTYYPGVRNYTTAKTVEVRAKATLADIDFQMVSVSQVDPPPAPSSSDPGVIAVKGRISLKGDVTAPPPAAITFDVPAKTGRAAAMISVAANGTFTLPLNKGEQSIALVDLPDGYSLASLTAGGKDLRSSPLRVEPGTELLVTLNADRRPRFRLIARVVEDTTQPPLVGEQVELVSPAGETTRTTVNAQGEVTFSQLFSGAYVLRLVSSRFEAPEKKIIISDSSVSVELRARARQVKQKMVNRRDVLRSVTMGGLALWSSSLLRASQQAVGKISILNEGGTNVVALSTGGDGLLLVDSGGPKDGDKLIAALKNGAAGSKVHTVFNTHYHLDQTGNNELFASSGAKIIAHDRTRQWMSTDFWLPDQDRYEKARPKAAWPTEVFFDKGYMTAGGESIEYGYLIMAHTSGDIYVHFKDANILAVGDVASPVKDPELDWITGAWIGARVDAMDLLLKLSNDQTKIVPGSGAVMTRAELKAERDMMEEVRVRLFKQVREGDSPQDMFEAGVLKGLPRAWKDPQKFLYAAAKGLWAHHNKLDANVV